MEVSDMGRAAEVFRNEQWESISFRELKKGDKFRLYDDGEQVVSKGETEFTAHTDPYPNKRGIFTIEI
jgi:hypothetical protein